MQKTDSPTLYRKELRKRILMVAMAFFRQHGIRAVKMDDIARELGISKRTLYEIYANKEELLLEGIQQEHKKKEAELQAYAQEGGHNVMDFLLKFYQQQMKELTEVPPQFLVDMQRFPRVMAYLQKTHKAHDMRAVDFFQKGVEEGYFRADVDYELISELGNGCMQSVMQSRLYKRYELSYIFRNVIFLFMRGFCTQKGLTIIDSMLQE